MQVTRSGNKFAATIGERTIRLKDMTKLVWQESVIRLVDFMQLPWGFGGHMPVITGFLRASLLASTSPVQGISISRPNDDQHFAWDMSQVEAVVRGAKVGQKIFITYLAEYANRLEYGFGGQPGYGFQRLAVQQWPYIKAAVVAELRAA